MGEIKRISNAHEALIAEDAAESLGAKYKLNGQWVETGTLGRYNCISFNGNNSVSTSRLLIDRGVTTDLMHRRTNYAA